jgi:hypothetical protein
MTEEVAVQVWILKSGWDYEGEEIEGVYARREDARQPFIDLAKGHHSEQVRAASGQAGPRFDEAAGQGNGAVGFRVDVYCLMLEPHEVIGATGS